jgi:deazaflavin-dependent oxidoreductase (nitroreductase family)
VSLGRRRPTRTSGATRSRVGTGGSASRCGAGGRWLASRLVAIADWALHQRWLVRAPIALFRLHLGGLAGGRLLLLEHRGRTSGARRSVVLEVIGRTDDGAIHVCSGLGPGAQWFRNVLADPRVLVTIGWLGARRYRADVLSGAEGAVVLEAYVTRHPSAWKELEPVLRAWAEPLACQRGERDWRRVAPVVALHPVA